MRVVKDAVERKNEILDAAEKLFGSKGFDATSTNDILKVVNIARGTLYYHFKSKEEIMDCLIDRYETLLFDRAKGIAEDKSIPVNERIFRVVMSLNMSEESNIEVMDHIHKPQNVLMHHKIQKMIINNLPPILTGIIRDGIEQGIYNTPFPYECMEMIIAYTNTIFDDDMVELSDDERTSRIEAFLFNTERLLGAKTGTFDPDKRMFSGG